MEINVTEVVSSTYRPLFADADVALTTVWVEFPEHNIVMALSNREDDGEGVWCADYRSDNGVPMFSHGIGDRTCAKSVASGELLHAILGAVAAHNAHLYN